MLYECYINVARISFLDFQMTNHMSIVSLLRVHIWVPLVKHIMGIYVLLRSVTNRVHIFIIGKNDRNNLNFCPSSLNILTITLQIIP